MPQKPCQFYNPATRGGCRNGDSCRFLHPSPSDSQNQSSTVATGRHNETAGGRNKGILFSPRGVCSYFWNKGSCDKGPSCRFNHSANPEIERRDRPEGGVLSINALLPLLTEAGLAKVTGPGSDAYFTPKFQTPMKVQSNLQHFLREDFRFVRPSQVYKFVALLYSASANDPSWSTEDGQVLLHQMADPKGRGMLRLTSIITWPTVSINTGKSIGDLSFQAGYLPLLKYLTSEYVVQSTLSHCKNALYSLIVQNIDHFASIIESCLNEAIFHSKSFKDPNDPFTNPPSMTQVLKTLIVLLFECTTLFKNSVSSYPGLKPLVLKLGEWTNAWIDGVDANPPLFNDEFNEAPKPARIHIIRHLTDTMNKLLAIVNRDDGAKRSQRPPAISTSARQSNEGVLAALETSYDPPGEDRPDGPRHDNDFVEILNIRIAPTHEELISRCPPFLPANIYDAPHPFPIHSMQRLLDIQFRLLREELTAPIRQSVKLITDDLEKPAKVKTRLSELAVKNGGKYRGHIDGHNSIMFNVYTNITFSSLTPDRRGISICLTFDAPPGRARSPSAKTRRDFWEGVSGKRLMQGGLIALVWKIGSETFVHLGTIASSTRELAESAAESSERVQARVVFFDPEIELQIFQSLGSSYDRTLGTKFLVEAPVMFESIRPFLEALRVEPEVVPFGEYLVHRPAGYLRTISIDPPAYARVPGFSFQLASLFPKEAEVHDLRLDANPVTIEQARIELTKSSRLDPSQANAIIDALTRELVLIQGPPGTGKSYTGVELLRVLIKNNIRPILMIAFTNHALDHMLRSVLDAGITKKIVRLGSRSKDERISQFSLETLERVSDISKLKHVSSAQYRELKLVEEDIKKLLKKLSKSRIDFEDIMNHLDVRFGTHYESLTSPSPWITTLFNFMKRSDGDGVWHTAGVRGEGEPENDTFWTFWRDGRDLEFLRKPDPVEKHVEEGGVAHSPRTREITGSSRNQFSILQQEVPISQDDEDSEEDESLSPEKQWQNISSTYEPEPVDPDPDNMSENDIPSSVPSPDNGLVLNPEDVRIEDFFEALGYRTVPLTPCSDRPLDELLAEGEMWLLSLKERQRLVSYWTDELKRELQETTVSEFEHLRDKHAEVLRRHTNITNEARRQLLQNVEIIGCTTTGAAQLTSLLKGIAPKVMLIEEAGQVLEAHVLGSLVQGVEHLILIGDPLQLRPTIQNFALSMDNKRGNLLYKFDMSLMERLATAGLPMSRIDIQRRMRPTISSLIRNTLYPGLQDHALVQNYPPVKGMAKNVFFFTHDHRENGGEDESASKYNMFEVEMIVDLVLYLLRQGSYSNEGDIVVLCAYLGQLAKLRDALASKIAVVIDERDQQELDMREDEGESVPNSQLQHVKVSQRVRLRTVDNYQGEQARIVILSLVRNSGASMDEDDEGIVRTRAVNASIGFLKSENRTNVALSRAQEGLYILGNAANLSSRSRMWHSVIEELRDGDALGEGFPIMCDRHPEDSHLISIPGVLPRVSPDGGCLRQCDHRLSCGHMCPYKCHSDDPNHISVICSQPCTRLCIRRHPCSKVCADRCGQCYFTVANVELPCGHTKDVPCYMLDDLDNVFCDAQVDKQLPGCSHQATLRCSEDPASYRCTARCNGNLPCCGRNCNAPCNACRDSNGIVSSEVRHRSHPCEKPLFCGHRCGKPCSLGHECNQDCREPCRQACPHARCRELCSAPCAPCQQHCTWRCDHQQCPVPCGSICARFPCDKRCEKLLRCGHRCPSVCGEDCSIQKCPLCATPDEGTTPVDLVLGRTLNEIDPDKEELDELIITLPNCGHVFTVETLDGICDLGSYYGRDNSGNWCSLESGTNDFLKPPACPTCRSSITAPRYGRVFKRADLDILERNVASRMSRGLSQVNLSLRAISTVTMKQDLSQEAARVETPKSSPSLKGMKATKQERTKLLKKPREFPLSYASLNPGDAKYHGVSNYDLTVWKKIIRPLSNAYTAVMDVARKRSSHLHAWEAAFSYLVRRELAIATENPFQAPRHPEEHAMRMATIMVGQPRPRADTRFRVEVFWVTIQIRFILVELARTWLRTISDRGEYDKKQQHVWATYICFLLESCSQDAQIAFDIATSSGSRRQMTKTSLLILKSELEGFSFNVYMSKKSDKQTRDTILETANEKIRVAGEFIRVTVASHLMGNVEDRDWVTSNFEQAAQKIIDQWKEIQRSIKLNTVFYEEMTQQEMEFVVQGLELPHTGHFYRCPNGHTFVIGDCGGANEVSRCPECHEPIGGTGHQLVAGNSVATEYENIARGQGIRRNPFPWAV